MSDKEAGLWDSDIDDEEECYSQGDSESPVDDLVGDPTYTYKGEIVPKERKSRQTTKLKQIYPNSPVKQANMPQEPLKTGSGGS